jgi:hypothetical protein
MNREPIGMVRAQSILDMDERAMLQVGEAVVLALADRAAGACLAVVVERMRPRIVEVDDASYALALEAIGILVGTYRRPVTSHQVLEDLRAVRGDLLPKKKVG